MNSESQSLLRKAFLCARHNSSMIPFAHRFYVLALGLSEAANEVERV